MSKADYKFLILANKLDKILLEFSDCIHILANTNINLSRNHPEYLQNWLPVLDKPRPHLLDYLGASKYLAKAGILNLIAVIFELLKPSRKKTNYSKINSGTDYLFVSHSTEIDESLIDVYFGEIITELRKLHFNTKRLLIKHHNIKSYIKLTGDDDVFFVQNTLAKSEVVKFILKNTLSLYRLAYFVFKNKFSLYESIILLAGQVENFSTFKLSQNILQNLKDLRPKKLITTYEGNGIEKIIFSICHNLGIQRYGYQHTTIIKSQYSIFRSLNSHLDPDFILVSGSYSAEKFSQKLRNQKPIIVVGSPKYREREGSMFPKKNIYSILLIPDGNKQSVEEFFNLGLNLGCSNSKLKVSIRSHPLFKTYLRKRFDEDFNRIPTNFSYSAKRLDYDLKSNNWVIYRNSSVCIESLFQGCEPVYYSNLYSNLDPLWELDSLHYSASNVNEILTLVSTPMSRSAGERDTIFSFAENYFSRINVENLVNS